MEVGVGSDEAELLLAGGVQVEDVLRRGAAQVQGLPVHIDISRLGHHVEDPEGARAGRPGVAQDRLVVAVKVAQVRRVGHSAELDDRLVPGLLNLVAVACSESNWLDHLNTICIVAMGFPVHHAP